MTKDKTIDNGTKLAEKIDALLSKEATSSAEAQYALVLAMGKIIAESQQFQPRAICLKIEAMTDALVAAAIIAERAHRRETASATKEPT